MSKTKVKNKAPAEVQITAEQLIREAKERDLEILPPVSDNLNIIFEHFYETHHHITSNILNLIFNTNSHQSRKFPTQRNLRNIN